MTLRRPMTCCHFLSGTEVDLVDDAGLSVDAGAFADIVVELVAFLLCDERSHRVILNVS